MLRIEYTPLSEIEGWPGNPKGHDDALISSSIEEFGFNEPMTLDEGSGRLVSGHGRTKALRSRKEGGKAPPGNVQVREDGEWLVPVIRGVSFNSQQEAERYLILVNRTTERGGWNEQALGEMLLGLDDLDMLDGLGFEDDELTGYLDLVSEPITGGEEMAAAVAEEPPETEPEMPELPKIPVTQPGDVWQLGPHRVYCEDALREDAEKRIDRGTVDAVFTDPPYAIFGSSTGMETEVADDKMVLPFFRSVLHRTAFILKPYGHAYICCDWRSYSAWWESMRRSGLWPKNMIVWDKGGGLGSMYGNAHELILFASARERRTVMRGRGGRTGSERTVSGLNVWRIPRASRSDGKRFKHNAQKPIPLVAKALEQSTDAGETVVDMFLGTGTTLLAAEQAGRVCQGWEIDAGWCDVIVERWQEMTGEKATRA